MAKDPAFLFYTGDFSTGTQFFTDEQVGKYIRLLMAQHQHGELSEKHMLNICKTYDEDIFSKFEKTAEGKFFNKRLDFEIKRRKAFSESRSKNRVNKSLSYDKHMNNISKSYVKHMENENENENENRIKNKDKKENENMILVHPFESEKWSEAWRGWIQYRKEIGKPYKSNRAAQSQLKWFSDNKFTQEQSIEIIQESIRNQYQGLFKPKQNGSKQSNADFHRQRVNDQLRDILNGTG